MQLLGQSSDKDPYFHIRMHEFGSDSTPGLVSSGPTFGPSEQASSWPWIRIPYRSHHHDRQSDCRLYQRDQQDRFLRSSGWHYSHERKRWAADLFVRCDGGQAAGPVGWLVLLVVATAVGIGHTGSALDSGDELVDLDSVATGLDCRIRDL